MKATISGARLGTTVSCWLCGGETSSAREYRDSALARCADCGFVFQPELPLSELRSRHGEEYFEDFYAQNDAQRSHEARVRLRWMRRLGLEAGRLLEVGAAEGQFLREARLAGFEPLGVEPEGRTAERARSRSGVDVLAGYLEDLELPAAGFDVACLWHVIEHIPDPVRALEHLRAVLRPGAHLVCEVPNIESVRAKVEGDRWAYLDAEHHVGFFSPATLRRALEEAGYEQVRTATVTPIAYARPRPRSVLRAARHLRFSRSNGAPVRGSDPARNELLRAVAHVPG